MHMDGPFLVNSFLKTHYISLCLCCNVSRALHISLDTCILPTLLYQKKIINYLMTESEVVTEKSQTEALPY